VAVAHDASVESHTGTTGSTSAASYNWTHTVVGVPRGILIFAYTNANADNNLSVDYGGVDIPKVPGGEAIDTTTEPGRCTAFFRGTGIPTGNQTVTVTRTNNANTCYAVSISVTAGNDTAVPPGSIILLQNNQTLAEQSVNDGSPGANSLRYAGIWSGLAAGAPTGANSTGLQSIIIGTAAGMQTVRETTAGQGARSVGFTSGTSDDVAAVHLAVSEIRVMADLTLAPIVPVNRPI
jgi:hypothetical protein